MKREHLGILLLATLVVGHVTGRMSRQPADDEQGGGASAVSRKAPARPVERPSVQPRPATAQPAPTQGTQQAAAVTAPTVSAPAEPSGHPDVDVWRVQLHEDDPWTGKEDSATTVVVFTAFGCQPCEAFKPHVDRLVAEYGDRVKIVVQQKVFNAEHPGAVLAAEASLAAHAQGRFWEYRDAAFDLGFALDRGNLEAIAGQLGLDMTAFRRALDQEAHRHQVLRDSLNAHEVGANSFPNVLVNGVRMGKPKDWASLEAVVVQEMARADALVAMGTPAGEVYDLRTRDGRSFNTLVEAPGPVPIGNGPQEGPADAKINVVIFDDFECPICANAAPNLRAFQARYPDNIRLVFKHFPLSSIHPDAMGASRAAAEAEVQGRFWEMHDIMFESRENLGRADLLAYAEELELDMVAFERAIDGTEHDLAISRDMAEGRRLGVTGTPTVFMNGKRYRGPKGLNPLGLEAAARVYFGFKGAK